MEQIYQFEMRVAGKEPEIQNFLNFPLFTLELRNKGVANKQDSQNQILSVELHGSSDRDLMHLAKDLAVLSKNLGLVLEAYSDNREEKAQQHLLIDRGRMMAANKVMYQEVDVNALSEQELEHLLFTEGFEKEELLKQADEHGVYRTDGMEEYGVFQPLAEYLETEPKPFLEYTDYFGDTIYVTPVISSYVENENLYLGLGSFVEDCKMMDHYADVTVNVGALPYLHSAIDTNNNGQNVLDFLQKHQIAEPTGQMIPSGFCLFPVYRFHEDKLRGLDPDGFKEYAKAHGRSVQTMKPPLDVKIQDAQQRQPGVKQEESPNKKGKEIGG